ncbi:MAG: hypothetical protein IJI68_11695 [Eggerthellaceae bacterium]|nr:hypothetical protein [Eggerthellaceae bacterium]
MMTETHMAYKGLSRRAKTGIAIACVAVILLGAIAFLNMLGKSADGQVDPITESSSSSSVSPDSASSGGLSSASPSPSATASSGKEDDVYGALKSAYYSDSGNSLGNLYSVEAYRADDGTMVVKISESKVHSDPTEVGEYRVADDLLDRIEAIVDRAGMKDWGELPPSEFIALDASTPSISLTYDPADSTDGWPEHLRYTFNDELPEGGANAINEIHDLMVSYAASGEQIASYTE